MGKVFPLAILMLSAAAAGAEFDRIYAGRYFWGPEVNSFSPCNSDEAYWASFDWAGRQMLAHYRQHQQRPYQAMYLRFRGHLLDERVGGFAEQYDGLIRISEVIEYSFEVPAECR